MQIEATDKIMQFLKQSDLYQLIVLLNIPILKFDTF